MKPPLLNVEIDPNQVVVTIRGVPHLILRRSDVVAIQAWIHGEGAVREYYMIQFTMRDGADVTCDYRDKPIWEALAKALAVPGIFDTMQGER